MRSFEKIRGIAISRKGPNLDLPKESRNLRKTSDDRFLAEFTKRIFQAGFVWSVIEKKWPGFEKAFFNFDCEKCANIDPDYFEKLMVNSEIVRNRQKIESVILNAEMIMKVSKEYGSFGIFLSSWSKDDQIGLMDYLKKNGSRLGGNSVQYGLRELGYDGFILTNDVVRALIREKIVDKENITSKKDLKAVQEAFNNWKKETGLSYAQLSRILAYSID